MVDTKTAKKQEGKSHRLLWFNLPSRAQNGNRTVQDKGYLVFLSAYRGFALVLAVTLLVTSRPTFIYTTWIAMVIFTMAYTFFKISHPSYRYIKKICTWSDFSLDIALSVVLTVLIDGLRSPFLLYSLSPLLTSALLFPRKITAIVSLVPPLSAFLGQVALRFTTGTPLFNPQALSISLLVIYAISSFLLGWLPYQININLNQNIQVQAIAEERKRLSRDIHDRVSQTLGIVRWRMNILAKKVVTGNISQALNDIAEIESMMSEAQTETRTVIEQLRVDFSGKQDFIDNLTQYATDFTQNYGIACKLNITDRKVNLSALAELELLCVTQEALHNVRKHARASRVDISLTTDDNGIELTIQDNGRGFVRGKTSNGYGLKVMEERVKSIGGELYVDSGWGNGTAVKAKIHNPRGVFE